MANWAMTNYAIEGPKDVLHRIYEAILHHDIEDSSSEDWEGNILNALGIEWERHVVHRRDDGKTDVSGYYMRGFIDVDSIDMTDDSLSFSAEEAWGVTDFHEVLEENLPAKVYYNVEEPGGEVYATNDKEGKYFPNRWYVDTCIDGEYVMEYFAREDAMWEWLSSLSGGRINNEEDVEAFNDKAQEEASDDFVYIHEFEIVK